MMTHNNPQNEVTNANANANSNSNVDTNSETSTISKRIQTLRKKMGLTQEELADKLFVSRQAVSKWESEQSLPDIDKIISLSEFFSCSTDYILRGIDTRTEHVIIKEQNNNSGNNVASKILYIASTFMIILGVFAAVSNWIEYQGVEDVVGSLIIQIVGIAGYYIGKVLSKEKPSVIIKVLNVAGLFYIPLSAVFMYIANFIFIRSLENTDGRVIGVRFELGYSYLVFSVVFAIITGIICLYSNKKNSKQK